MGSTKSDSLGQILTKQCSGCKQEKPFAAFNKKAKGKYGLQAYCRCCQVEADGGWRITSRIKNMLKGARYRAKRDGVPFNLTEEDIAIPSHCPVLGIPMEFGPVDDRDNSPSLDRIIPSKGYVRGNITVVSFRANRIKNNATVEELKQVAFYYEDLLRSLVNEIIV